MTLECGESIEANERPIMVQGSNAPIVIRKGAKFPDLVCIACNSSVLITNYLAECFVGIGLQCFRCGSVTWTPSLPDGEVFPYKFLSLGSSGKYLIASSIVDVDDVVLTCEQEIQLAHRKVSPRASKVDVFNVSIENFDLMAAELNVLAGGRFDKYLQSAKRSLINGDIYFRDNPLAWSIELIKKQLAGNELSLDDRTLVALAFVQGYRAMLNEWREHIHFSVIAIELCAYFYHSLVQLTVASYLYSRGNKVAINMVCNANGERSADLYVRLSGSKKLFLEVKCPKALEWTNREVSAGRFKKTIEKCLSDSRGQIDLETPGVLIIGTTCIDKGFLAGFELSVSKVLKARGKSYPAVAAIGIYGLKEVNAAVGHNVMKNVSTSVAISLVKNPHYFEDDPIIS
ncbi:hypothetical protein ACTZGP_25440 [Pseudomonas putida]|uniref:hypothetical protein n=1 Tax=Pseudomonas putida TaxID=303 RepID=UPI003FD27EEF